MPSNGDVKRVKRKAFYSVFAIVGNGFFNTLILSFIFYGFEGKESVIKEPNRP
jgi:hypothetical protein